MLRDGYAATTVATIAKEAGVSAETVYKTFGGKPGIVRAVIRKGLEGAGSEPAQERSNRLRGVSTGHQLVAGWTRLAQEVAPRVSPLLALLREAAASDARIRPVLDEVDDERLVRMRDNARALLATGDVRPGLTLRDVTDVLFTVTSAELFELLVMRRGWSTRRFARFQQATMAGALLAPEPTQEDVRTRRTEQEDRPNKQHGKGPRDR